MNPLVVYTLTGAVLLSLGVAGVFSSRHILRKIVAINMAGSGVFLVFVALASRPGESTPDPVPHALVLTGIVVAVSATAVALALVRKLAEEPPPGKRRKSRRESTDSTPSD